jgi:hypothetical protein
MNKESIIKALKELGRIAILFIVSLLLTEGVLDGLVSYLTGAKLDTTTKAQIIGLMTTGLKTLDKYLHELGKASDNATLVRGLTQF